MTACADFTQRSATGRSSGHTAWASRASSSLASHGGGVPNELKGRSLTRIAAWSRDELALLLELADELKAERAPPGAPRPPGQDDRSHLPQPRPGRGSPSRSASPNSGHGALPAGGGAAARPRGVVQGHGPRPVAVPLGAHDPHVRPGGSRGVRRARVHSRHQRADGREPPAAGAVRRDDAARTVRHARGPSRCVRRGRQQRVPLAHAHRGPVRLGLRRRHARRLRAVGRVRGGRSGGCPRQRGSVSSSSIPGRRPAAPMPCTPTSG